MLASSFDSRSSIEGWKEKSNSSRVRLNGRWAVLVLIVTARRCRALTSMSEQVGQHLRVGELFLGGRIQAVLQRRGGFALAPAIPGGGGPCPGRSRLPSQRDVLADVQRAMLYFRRGELPGDCPRSRATVPDRQAVPLAGQGKPLTGVGRPGMDRQAPVASPDLHRSGGGGNVHGSRRQSASSHRKAPS